MGLTSLERTKFLTIECFYFYGKEIIMFIVFDIERAKLTFLVIQMTDIVSYLVDYRS